MYDLFNNFTVVWNAIPFVLKVIIVAAFSAAFATISKISIFWFLMWWVGWELFLIGIAGYRYYTGAEPKLHYNIYERVVIISASFASWLFVRVKIGKRPALI